MLMFTTTDLVAIWTKVPTDKGEHEVIIASAYLPGDEETAPTRELVALVNYCKENHLRWIIGCDANAHHTIWGSTNINARVQMYYQKSQIGMCPGKHQCRTTVLSGLT
ncbi:uncharacterized protein LOC129250361 [Anastrepha obliqua]|uniref:uncharacterized protein LOC129250361 n=1 Tax=Anastrepha obliqua TaxID=95512 RepID=UPI002409FC94|nr:uncharacterized protein LOC129250361 [Anastrepha obliqua]